ncbi:MAG: damage-inducible protein, partial [Gluconobacter oxydans]
ARAGECADFEVEACDAKGRLAYSRCLAGGLALPAALANRPDQEAAGARRASV